MILTMKRPVAKGAFLLLLSIGFLHLFTPVNGTTSWSSPTLVDSSSSLNNLPSSLQASNGTLWIAWQSTRNNQSTGRTDIIYRTYTSGVWSRDYNLTNSGWNSGPSLVQLANGTILAFWSIKSGNSYLVYSSLTNGRTWSSPTQITHTTLNDTQAAATIAPDGTIWLVWTRVNATNTSVPYVEQLFYKTLKNGVWSPETQLTNDSNQNFYPNVMVGKDGIVRVLWSKGAAGNPYQIFSKTYNGISWTTDKQNVTSSSTDEHASMIQDRNGTLWLFWGRLIVVSQLVQYYIVYGKYSYDMGRTWSSEIQLTPTPGTTIFDSYQPNAIQTSFGVKSVWVIYTSNYNVIGGYDIYAIQSTGINPVHDVRVAGLSATNNLGTSWEYPGGLKSVGQTAIMTITVAIANIGDYLEKVNVTLSSTNTTLAKIGSLKSFVGPGNTMNFYFYWNTTNIKPARYGLSVNITPLPGETLGNIGDNSFAMTNQIHIIPLADLDQDGTVTITDFSIMLYDYGFSSSCNCSRWDPYADIDNTGTINIIDIGVALANYGIPS